MIFKGIRFRRTNTVVTLPFDPTDGSVQGAYVSFGRVCDPGTKGAIKTGWTRGGTSLYAKPIPISGHSRTNMAYGADGRVYLYHEGRCYTAPPAKKMSLPQKTTSLPAPFAPKPRGRRSDLAERAA